MRADLRHQHVEPADRLDREVGRRDHGRHLDEELDHVDDEHAPQARVRREDDVQQAHEDERLPVVEAEEHVRDLDRGEVDRGHDHAVEEEAEIDRPEAAHEARGLARVAQLVELEVGEDARAPPEPREEEDRRDAREHEGPPLPVPGDALAAHDVGDEVRRVAREGRGHHREAREPPRHRAAGGEELGRVLPRAPPEEERRQEADGECRGDDHPVEGVQPHEDSLVAGWSRARPERESTASGASSP